MRKSTLIPLLLGACVLARPAAAQEYSLDRFGPWSLLHSSSGCLGTYTRESQAFQIHASSDEEGLIALKSDSTRAFRNDETVPIMMTWVFADGQSMDVDIEMTVVGGSTAFQAPLERSIGVLRTGPRITATHNGQSIYDLHLPADADSDRFYDAFAACRRNQ